MRPPHIKKRARVARSIFFDATHRRWLFMRRLFFREPSTRSERAAHGSPQRMRRLASALARFAAWVLALPLIFSLASVPSAGQGGQTAPDHRRVSGDDRASGAAPSRTGRRGLRPTLSRRRHRRRSCDVRFAPLFLFGFGFGFLDFFDEFELLLTEGFEFGLVLELVRMRLNPRENRESKNRRR